MLYIVTKRPKPIRFSERTNWYLDELVRVGYGLNRSEIVRRFVWDGIKRAQLAEDLPKRVAAATDIPEGKLDPEEEDDAEESST